MRRLVGRIGGRQCRAPSGGLAAVEHHIATSDRFPRIAVRRANLSTHITLLPRRRRGRESGRMRRRALTTRLVKVVGRACRSTLASRPSSLIPPTNTVHLGWVYTVFRGRPAESNRRVSGVRLIVAVLRRGQGRRMWSSCCETYWQRLRRRLCPTTTRWGAIAWPSWP